MKLFLEATDSPVQAIVEAAGEGRPKNYFIEGVFAQADRVNKNGRVYPVHVLSEAVEAYTKTFIVTNRAVGELGHPPSPTVNYDRVSHIITEIKQDGGNFIGKARVMDTPMGKIVKTLIDEGVQMSVSTRGLGALDKASGHAVVKEGFRLSAVDIVTDPSAPDAFVNGLLEGTSFIFDKVSGNWVAEQMIEQVVEEIHNKTILDEQAVVKVISSFIRTL